MIKNKLQIMGFLALSVLGYSQVTIGKYASTTPRPSSPSVLLEFGDEKNKGLILPYVETLPAATPGTLVYDATADAQYKVKVKLKSSWFDLSQQSATKDMTATDIASFTSGVKGIQTSKTEKPNAKVIIGSSTSTEAAGTGILVLESTTRAMVLPIVDSYDQIPSPSPGMIVYTKANKQLAVFNGKVWTFWKP